MGTESTLSRRLPIARARAWIAPFLGVVAYPGLIAAFAAAVRAFEASEDPVLEVLFSGASVLFMLLAASVPITAIPALLELRKGNGSHVVFLRRALHLVFAVPPLYTLTVVVTSLLGVGDRHLAIWPFVLAALGAGLFAGSRNERPWLGNRQAATSWLRVVHGSAAALLLAGFLIAHIGNHGLALWSVALHGRAAELLRVWYRSDWVEPVVIGLFAVMALTGIPMVGRYTRTGGDTFRVLQTTSGVYLAVFICSHLTAVLRARYAGVETDWVFAVGPNGLVYGSGMLIPYYILGICTLIVHLALGLRRVALSRRLDPDLANRLTYALIGLGGVVTFLTTLAMMGLHIGA